MLVAIACVLTLTVVPMIPLPARTDPGKPATDATVQAAPRLAFNIEQPVVLSRTPYLELERGKFSVQSVADGAPDRSVVLQNARFRLDPTRGSDTSSAHDVLSPLMQQLASLGMDRILIRSAMVRFADSATGEIGPIDADVDLADRAQISLRGVAIFHGDALSFEATAGRESDVEGDTRLGSGRRQVTAAVKGEHLGEVRIDGELSSHKGLAGDVEARLTSPASLMRWLGAPVRQASALRNIVLGGRARWLDGMFDLQDARVTLDGQKPATGALRVRFRAGRPIVEGTLAFATLDLTRLGAATEDGAATSQANGQQPQTGSAQAIPLPAIGNPLRTVLATVTRDLPAYLDLDADLRLSAGSVNLRGGVRGRGAATITIDRRQLAAEFAEVEWAGNKARLHLEASGQNWLPTFSVRGRIDLLQAQDLVAPLVGHPIVTGPAVLTLDLRGRGDGPDLMPGTMSGRLSVVAGAAARSPLDPMKIAERATGRPAREAQLLQSAQLTIESLDLRLMLQDKVVRIDQSLLKTAAGQVRLAGQVDRASAAIDLTLTRATRARATGKVGEQPDAPEESFGVTGTWTAPIVTRLQVP